MAVDYKKFKPMNDDVLLIHKPARELRGDSSIIFMDDEDKDKVLYFNVLAVGTDTTDVKVGDVVMVEWGRCVPPFDMDVDGKTKKVTITSEKELMAIVEV